MHASGTSRARRIVPQMRDQRAGRFTFINVSEPTQSKDESLRRFVRSNAMRTYRQKQRQKAILRRAQHAFSENEERGCPQPSLTAERQLDWLTDWHDPVEEIQIVLQSGTDPLEMRDTQGDERSSTPACGHSGWIETGHLSSLPLQDPVVMSPKKLIGDGMSDPFNVYPSGGSPYYNSYMLNHFVSDMARTCLPIDLGNASNPLAKMWIPYAMTDPVLFLATINFAAVHLDILRGQYSSPHTLTHKIETIRLVNARLQNSAEALSNENIGSVAMLAAMESMNGNCGNLQIHMDGLAEMVKMRGGLQELGWSGVLRMFISWQDLLYSAMMASLPPIDRKPLCAHMAWDLPVMGPTASLIPVLDRSSELQEQMGFILQQTCDLTESLTHVGRSTTSNDHLTFSTRCFTVEHRLRTIKIRKPPGQMTMFDYFLETCRLGSFMYLKRVLHNLDHDCAILQDLKEQLKSLLLEGEGKWVGDVYIQLKRGSFLWVVFMGGTLSINEEEETWFAERIVRLTKAWHFQGPKSWTYIEEHIRKILWERSLKMPECLSLWDRIKTMCRRDLG